MATSVRTNPAARSAHATSVAGGMRLLPWLLALVAVVWLYWPTLKVLAYEWGDDPQYSHGYLVPIFAAGLLYLRRSELNLAAVAVSWSGVPLLVFGLTLKILAAHFAFEWLDPVSLLPVVAGVCLLLGGAATLRWAWTSVLFLFFMIPLPYTLEIALREPLRRVGTYASAYLMQAIGLPAFVDGNIITVNDARIGVAEACSGIRMLMVFFALSTSVAILMRRPLWERFVVVLSAIPIAIAANVLRITTTGGLHVVLADSTVFGIPGPDFADKLFHDWAGWLMMPVALLLLQALVWFLRRVVVVEEDRPMSVGLAGRISD